MKEFWKLNDFLQISSYGYDDNGKKFINSIEGKYPYNIFAVQYHPEKNPLNQNKRLRGSREIFNEKYFEIMSLVSTNFFTLAVEDYFYNLSFNKHDEKINEVKSDFVGYSIKQYSVSENHSIIKDNDDDFIKKIRLESKNLIYNYTAIPIYLFSE